MAFVLLVAWFSLLVLAFALSAFPHELMDRTAAVTVVLDGQRLPARAAVVVVPIVVRVRAGDDADDLVVAVGMMAPRANLVDSVFQHALLPAMFVDLSQIRWRAVQLMDIVDSLVMFTVALTECGFIETRLRFVASEIPCLGLVAVETSVTLALGEGPFIGAGRG